LTLGRSASPVVAACVLVLASAAARAGTPYDLDAGRDLERRAPAADAGSSLDLPDVERPPDAGGNADAPAAAADAQAEFARALQQLGAPEWIDRLTGIYALQRMGADAAPAAPRLAPLLEDENGSVRIESAECLFRIGSPAVPILVVALASRDDGTRALAVRTLGRIGLGARSAVPALDGLRDDPSPDVVEQATFALPLIAPQGPRDWLWKIGFEIGDEPWGIPIVAGVFCALSIVTAGWRARKRSRAKISVSPRPTDDSLRDMSGAVPSSIATASLEGDDDEDDRAARDGTDGDDALLDDEAGDGQGGRAHAEGGAETNDDPLQPTQGLPHAGAGLIAMSVAVLIAFLGSWNEVPEERHGAWHFAGLFFLFGWLFFKIGLKGELTARRARARRDANRERWLKDRAWDRTGTGPIRAERVAPNLAALALWVGFLLPFHTVWALPWSYWGVWVVLGIFDVIGVVILVGTLRRVWWRLRSGRCRLRWDAVPVRPGGTFTARFETARTIGDGTQIEATLRCLRDRGENRVIGDEPAADADEVWAEKRSFRVHDRPEGGSWAQVSFAVPAKARGTSSYAGRPVRWVVVVSMPIAGPDFWTTFPVPIYR
jgi:hypothetical protein